MSKTLLLAWADPKDSGSEEEFNAWYDGTHVPQLREAIPSITRVTRYRAAALPPEAGPSPSHRYLAVYELDEEDVARALGALGSAMAEGRLDMSPAMDLASNPPALQWFQST